MRFSGNMTARFKACLVVSAICIFMPPMLDARQDSLSKPVEKKKIKIHNSDLTRIIETDSGSVYRFQGNVEMEHNNAVMYCDSAIMYPSNFFEAMGNTRVTSGTTTVSGDVMTYDGKTAMVRGKIVYLTDGSSTLRTKKVDFDTETETGFFENEGTIVDSTRLLESQKGYYHSKIKEFDFWGKVESDAKKYLLRSDSMKYNTRTKLFTFYSHTHIWSDNGYLYADKGRFDSEQNIMFFYRNSYILSSKQEIFADSVYYESVEKKGRLYSNVQIADTAKKTIAVSDFADFNMNTEDFIMRNNPSVIMFDDKDTTFMRADTIFSVNVSVADKNKQNSQKSETARDSTKFNGTIDNAPKTLNVFNLPDSAQTATNIGTIDNSPSDTAKIQIVERDSVEMFNTAGLPDSAQTATNIGTIDNNPSDTAKIQIVADSVHKELYAYNNVKLFRRDFQLICDSLFFNNIDSVWKVYKNPIVWEGKRMQITSDSMKFIIKDNDLKQAIFNGNGMIVSPEGDPERARYFNQIKAKNIDVYFKNGKVHILNASGNLQTVAFSLSDFSVNRTDASGMKMTFDSLGKLRILGYYEAPQGDNNPIILLREDEVRLPGLAPKFDLRPTSGNDVINRIIRPTERAVHDSIPKPLFPITAKIDKLEEDLKNGIQQDEPGIEPAAEPATKPEKPSEKPDNNKSINKRIDKELTKDLNEIKIKEIQ